jgi:hypothetical protein
MFCLLKFSKTSCQSLKHQCALHRKQVSPKEKPEEAASLLGKAHDKGSETRVDIQVHAGSQARPLLLHASDVRRPV